MKNKTYTISLIFGLATIILILFFIWPLLMEIKDNSKNLLSIKNSMVTLEIQNNEIENFKKIYENYKPNLEKMNQLFVDPKNPVDFIKLLENTAIDSGIKLQISLLPDSQQKNKNTVMFQLFSSEDFLKILNFSEKLENGPYLVEIKNLTIKNPEGQNTSKNDTSLKIDATFLIKTFTKQ